MLDRIRVSPDTSRLHRESQQYRDVILGKLAAYHAYIQTGIIAQGILLHLALTHATLVWKSFGSWLRTIRPSVPPFEMVVMLALKNTYPECISESSQSSDLQKFHRERLDPARGKQFSNAA
jgi:hypothetical protein